MYDYDEKLRIRHEIDILDINENFKEVLRDILERADNAKRTAEDAWSKSMGIEDYS